MSHSSWTDQGRLRAVPLTLTQFTRPTISSNGTAWSAVSKTVLWVSRTRICPIISCEIRVIGDFNKICFCTVGGFLYCVPKTCLLLIIEITWVKTIFSIICARKRSLEKGLSLQGWGSTLVSIMPCFPQEGKMPVIIWGMLWSKTERKRYWLKTSHKALWLLEKDMGHQGDDEPGLIRSSNTSQGKLQ